MLVSLAFPQPYCMARCEASPFLDEAMRFSCAKQPDISFRMINLSLDPRNSFERFGVFQRFLMQGIQRSSRSAHKTALFFGILAYRRSDKRNSNLPMP